MKDFAAIDFETANHEHSSVCSVGLIIVNNNEIKDKVYRLIRPCPNYYIYWNTLIHGLTNDDTDNASDFPSVWHEISSYIGDLPLVVHNKAFDESCLNAVYNRYNMTYPGYAFYCTYQTARRVFKDKLPNFQLPTVAKQCGYDLTQHHNALADAEACAWIAREIL